MAQARNPIIVALAAAGLGVLGTYAFFADPVRIRDLGKVEIGAANERSTARPLAA